MTDTAPSRPPLSDADRRRVDRRASNRVTDVSLPELRRMMITTTLFVIVLLLFIWMVRTVIIAAILAVVIAVYIRPLFLALRRRSGRDAPAALAALAIIILPVLGLLVYSYMEIADRAIYIEANRDRIADQIDAAVRRLPFVTGGSMTGGVRRLVLEASDYGARIPAAVRRAFAGFSVSASVFLFTAFYVMVDTPRITAYVRGKIPLRYTDLVGSLETHVGGVLHGAIYSTFVTQGLKSALIFVMNIVFGVPLAGVLAILSFIIGFFPIVGSWSVYLPVALWLLVFQDAPVKALLMIVVGFLVNTVFISTYLRPKLAAERSGVLNFYWMFVGLVTGVYTFGLPGILLGPILIGLLKAIIDTVTTTNAWRSVETERVPQTESEGGA